jgi:uncharacterized membrane protein
MSDSVVANGRHPILERQQPFSALCATLVWAITAIFALALVALIVVAPFAQANGYPTFALAIYKTFSYVCHQIPERSFHFLGYKFAVCSRCTGIYSGLAIAILIYPLVRSFKDMQTPALVWLFVAAAPLAIDWSLGYFSIWQNNHASRFSTGALLGATAVFYILPGLIELTYKASAKQFSATQR